MNGAARAFEVTADVRSCEVVYSTLGAAPSA